MDYALSSVHMVPYTHRFKQSGKLMQIMTVKHAKKLQMQLRYLILKVTLASLVADGAVQGMIDLQAKTVSGLSRLDSLTTGI